MKVNKLIECLEKLDGEADVVIDLVEGAHHVDDKYEPPSSGGDGVVWISVGDMVDFSIYDQDLMT